MLKRLYPTAYYKRIFDIPLHALKKKNIKGLVFDVDNTLAPYDCAEPDEEIIQFMKKAADEGFGVCLLSNNTKKRVTRYNERLNVFAVPNAFKPSRRGLRKAMALLGTDEKTTVLIGDQIFTDVWCGNRAGVRTILVEPCTEKDEWITNIKRGLEKRVIRAYQKGRGKK